MLGLNFLVANQIDPRDRRADEGRGARRGSARNPARSSAISIAKRVRSGAPSRSTRRCCSGRTCASSSTPTRCSASGSTTRAADSSIAPWRHSPMCCGSIPTTNTRSRTSRSSTKNSTSGPTRTRRARSWRRCDGPAAQPGHLAILGFLENELGTQALKRMDYAEAARRLPGRDRARPAPTRPRS